MRRPPPWLRIRHLMGGPCEIGRATALALLTRDDGAVRWVTGELQPVAEAVEAHHDDAQARPHGWRDAAPPAADIPVVRRAARARLPTRGPRRRRALWRMAALPPLSLCRLRVRCSSSGASHAGRSGSCRARCAAAIGDSRQRLTTSPTASRARVCAAPRCGSGSSRTWGAWRTTRPRSPRRSSRRARRCRRACACSYDRAARTNSPAQPFRIPERGMRCATHWWHSAWSPCGLARCGAEASARPGCRNPRGMEWALNAIEHCGIAI